MLIRAKKEGKGTLLYLIIFLARIILSTYPFFTPRLIRSYDTIKFSLSSTTVPQNTILVSNLHDLH